MKHYLFKLVMFLLLGMIVNVTVAWVCALWSDMHWPYRWESDRVDAELKSRFLVLLPQDNEFEISTSTQIGFGIKYDTAFVYTVLHRSSNYQGKDDFAISLSTYSEGWPLKAFSCEHFYFSRRTKPNGTINGGFRPPHFLKRSRVGITLDPERVLSFLPIWPGFAINTILYAAILWLLTLGPFTARRMLRRKRGLCIKCGYDLRGASEGGCPECGWGREAEV